VWYRFAKIIIAGKEHIIRKIADYFSNQGHNTSQLSERLNELDKANKLPIIELRKDGVMFDNKFYTDFLEFTEAVDALYTELIFLKQKKEQKELTKEKINFTPGEIQVFACNSVNDTIRYGAGTSWCISQPGNTMFQSYRDNYQSTFYYVSDGTRPPEDPLSRVMVDMQAKGIVKLTDKNNQTGTIAEFGNDYETYFDYLRQNGVDTSIFVNKPVTEEERKENELLGKRNVTPNWFEELPAEYKSKYIGRGHLLTDQQLESIINLQSVTSNNTADFLIEQYLNTGISIPPSQKAMLFGNNQYRATYNRRRNIAIEEIKKHLGNDDWRVKDYALRSGDFELIDEIINEKGINNYNFYYVNAPEEMLRYLFSKGLSADRVAWDLISSRPLLSEEFIREFADSLDWDIISQYQTLSGDFILDFEDSLDMDKVLKNYPIPEKVIRTFADRVDWNEISRKQPLSEEFIREFKNRVDWWSISAKQKLSEDFIIEFADRVNWKEISWHQKLSEDLIKDFADRVDWTVISRNQKLSERFIKEFAEFGRINPYSLEINPNISDKIKKQLGTLFPWYRPST